MSTDPGPRGLLGRVALRGNQAFGRIRRRSPVPAITTTISDASDLAVPAGSDADRVRPPCNAPFASLYLDPRGEVRTCCQNVWQRVGNVRDSSLIDLWRGEPMQRLRSAMTAHDLTLGCERCAVHIDAGRPETAYARVFDWLEPTDASTDWPIQLELALSNACNLQCVMCNGELSSSIRIHREGRPALPTVYDERFFSDLDLFLPQLRSVVFLGGEPFLAKESLRVMDRLLDLGLTPQCSITTNGTQWNDRIERLVTSLPTHITVSVDGATADTFGAIRAGADHAVVLRNIARFRSAVAASGGSLSISFCLMRNNWHEFGQVLRWADDQDLSVYVNTVTHPPQLSFAHGPADELAEVVRALEAEGATLRRALTRNGSTWDQQLDALQRLVLDRQSSPVASVSVAAPTRRQPSRTPPSASAEIEADPVQVIRRVDPGDAHTIGVQLEGMEGRPIWDLQPLLCASLGDTAETGLFRFEDGAEELEISFERDGRRTTMLAHLSPGEGGRQVWRLEFRRDRAPRDGLG